ncbi:hypothetical protein JTF06_12110 [Desemzia sp. RIT804]|uniref:hypothetical protein n=1 Tax=Desemzia sp. RIT 804 TaxID=2810209 RepID=UPI00194F9C75|nr:hypothetical protein [Desemzia sp. RIT 804]MBM6615630.1 hypothetical protein [Desemzia sp. RIT 804]
MSKMQFKLNSSGVSSLLKSAEMQNVLSKQASAIKNRCGEGYEQDIFVGKNRANAMVWADSYQARKENMENNTLLKAVR